LCGEGVQRRLEFEVEVVGLRHPGSGVDGAKGRFVLGQNRGDAATPDVGAGAQMGQHVVGRPLVGGRGGAQLGGAEIGRGRDDMRWGGGEEGE